MSFFLYQFFHYGQENISICNCIVREIDCSVISVGNPGKMLLIQTIVNGKRVYKPESLYAYPELLLAFSPPEELKFRI